MLQKHVIPDQVIGFVGSGQVHTKLGADAEHKINSMFMASARLGPEAKKATMKPPAGGGGGGNGKSAG